MYIPRGIAPPSSAESQSRPTSSIFPSSTSSIGRIRRYSKAVEYLPPNCTCMSSLRTVSPSKAAATGTGMSIFETVTFTPRTSTHVSTMRLWSSSRTSSSYVQTPVGRISGISVSQITGNPMLIAPAPLAYFRSSISPSPSPKAKIRARV